MSDHTFGGNWTTEKLMRLQAYLHAYVRVFSNQTWAKTIYIDAFAGSGSRTITLTERGAPLLGTEALEWRAVLDGSPRIALDVEPPFDEYLFIDENPDWIQSLNELRQDFPDRNIKVVPAEANTYLKRWCQTTSWKNRRGVLFLDPYGMQVDWTLIEAIAATQAIDLWLLFPIGVAVNRLLTKSKPPPTEWAESLTRFFGTDDWREHFYPKRLVQTLFGETEEQAKDADFEKISAYFVERLRTVFPGVAPNPLPLRNSKNVPIYLFCFAAGNPKGAPLGVRIANHILRS